MHRKILIAEQADTLRTVAEALLRQNGYDVIGVTAAQKAREVLEFSRPDLIIVGADLMAPDGARYYERVRQDSQTSRIPILLIEPADKSEITFPSEMVIPRPFDPQDFLNKVTNTLKLAEKAPSDSAGPLAGAEIDDRFLDAALGLDEIKVTSSEVMDQTSLGPRNQKAAAEKLIGLDSTHESENDESGGTKVDSLVLDMNSSRVRRQVPGRQAPPAEGTGKLEIMSDQYGLSNPAARVQNEHSAHDYDWFIDAIKKDGNTSGGATSEQADSDGPQSAEPSASVDSIASGPAQRQAAAQVPNSGVEQFIDEFKKEMQQLRDTESDPLVPDVRTIEPDQSSDQPHFQEKLEQLGPAELDMFTREFAQELGRRVAEVVAARIDAEKLMHLIKAEIVERLRKSK